MPGRDYTISISSVTAPSTSVKQELHYPIRLITPEHMSSEVTPPNYEEL